MLEEKSLHSDSIQGRQLDFLNFFVKTRKCQSKNVPNSISYWVNSVLTTQYLKGAGFPFVNSLTKLLYFLLLSSLQICGLYYPCIAPLSMSSLIQTSAFHTKIRKKHWWPHNHVTKFIIWPEKLLSLSSYQKICSIKYLIIWPYW